MRVISVRLKKQKLLNQSQGGEIVRFIHSNNERIIVNLTDGWLEGAFVTINNEGIKIHNIPGESKSREKFIEWADLMVMNQALEYYNPEEGIFELQFVLQMLQASAFIFEGRGCVGDI
jgi:hypothetical protein